MQSSEWRLARGRESAKNEGNNSIYSSGPFYIYSCMLSGRTGLTRADVTISALALQTRIVMVQNEKALQVAQPAVSGRLLILLQPRSPWPTPSRPGLTWKACTDLAKVVKLVLV